MTTGVAIGVDAACRLRQFKESPHFRASSNDVAKSSYWKAHSSFLVTDMSSADRVNIGGQSGFYVPPAASTGTRAWNRVRSITAQPARALQRAKAAAARRLGAPRFMSYDAAFDAVMRHDPVADPELSPWRVDHRALAGKAGVRRSAAAIRAHYEAWSGLRATAHIIGHYYYQNILRGYLPNGLGRVLEIGSGSGNLPAILFHDWQPSRFVMVDLPEAIAVAFVFLARTFPKALIVLPNECEGTDALPDADFVFLTTEQIARIPDNSIDVVVNCHSFQEMTPAQIDIYFTLIQRACRSGGHFFTANRVEKIPSAPDSYQRSQPDPPVRFAEYPWRKGNEVLVHEVSRLLRLVQPDNVSMRLERIIK